MNIIPPGGSLYNTYLIHPQEVMMNTGDLLAFTVLCVPKPQNTIIFYILRILKKKSHILLSHFQQRSQYTQGKFYQTLTPPDSSKILNLLSYRWENKNTDEKISKEEILGKYFSLLTDQDIMKLYRIYEDDFRHFGYKFKFRSLDLS